MRSNLQQYFDSTPNLTESQKLDIINLSNNYSKTSPLQLLNLLLKYSKSQRKVTAPLLILITNIVGLSSTLECKCMIEIMKKKRIWQRKWTKAEDQQLKNMCRQKQINWCDIANQLNSLQQDGLRRQTNTIKDRWYNKLNPVITQQSWKQQEDTILLENVLKFGKQWPRIQGMLQFKRTEKQIIRRYYEILIMQESQSQKRIQMKDKGQLANIQQQVCSRYKIDLDEVNLIQDYQKNQVKGDQKNEINQNGKSKKKIAKTQRRTTEIISQVMQQVQQGIYDKYLQMMIQIMSLLNITMIRHHKKKFNSTRKFQKKQILQVIFNLAQGMVILKKQPYSLNHNQKQFFNNSIK